MSRVTLAVPLSTISMMVFQALLESLSVGEMKLPAALLMTMCGKQKWSIQSDIASLTACGWRMSAAKACT